MTARSSAIYLYPFFQLDRHGSARSPPGTSIAPLIALKKAKAHQEGDDSSRRAGFPQIGNCLHQRAQFGLLEQTELQRGVRARHEKIPLCATCIGSPPVNEVIGRDQEDRLGLGTYLEDAYARHIQEVVSPGLRNADEHRVAGLAAYDCPHPMHVGGNRPKGIGGAATRTGGLDERHVKREGYLQDAPSGVTI